MKTLFAIGLAVIIIGGIGYWTWSQKSDTTVTSTMTESPTTQQPTTQDSSSDLKMYRNEKYGFEYKYRSDYSVYEGGISYESNVIKVVSFGPDKEGEFVYTTIRLWKEFPRVGRITSVQELKTAVTQWATKTHTELTSGPYTGKISVVEQGGFTIVLAEGLPGLVGSEPYAFILIDQGILVIYAGQVSQIKKI